MPYAHPLSLHKVLDVAVPLDFDLGGYSGQKVLNEVDKILMFFLVGFLVEDVQELLML